MGYIGDEDDDKDLPEAPPIQMVTETFSQIISQPEQPKDDNKE